MRSYAICRGLGSGVGRAAIVGATVGLGVAAGAGVPVGAAAEVAAAAGGDTAGRVASAASPDTLPPGLAAGSDALTAGAPGVTEPNGAGATAVFARGLLVSPPAAAGDGRGAPPQAASRRADTASQVQARNTLVKCKHPSYWRVRWKSISSVMLSSTLSTTAARGGVMPNCSKVVLVEAVPVRS
jgi:hypothetical protein